MNLPHLTAEEAWTIGKRINNIIGKSGTVGSKLKALRKRGKVTEKQVAALLRTKAALSLAPPSHATTAPSNQSLLPPLQFPPPQHPPPPPPPTEPLCARTRAAVVAATPLQKLYGVPDPSAWGPDEADVPDDPQPSSHLSSVRSFQWGKRYMGEDIYLS